VFGLTKQSFWAIVLRSFSGGIMNQNTQSFLGTAFALVVIQLFVTMVGPSLVHATGQPPLLLEYGVTIGYWTAILFVGYAFIYLNEPYHFAYVNDLNKPNVQHHLGVNMSILGAVGAATTSLYFLYQILSGQAELGFVDAHAPALVATMVMWGLPVLVIAGSRALHRTPREWPVHNLQAGFWIATILIAVTLGAFALHEQVSGMFANEFVQHAAMLVVSLVVFILSILAASVRSPGWKVSESARAFGVLATMAGLLAVIIFVPTL
jgi:hypothetical protein